MAADPSHARSSVGGLLLVTYGVLILIGAIGLGFGLSEVSGGNDGPLVLLLAMAFIAFPYGLAALMSWLTRHSRRAAISLLVVWVCGGAVSVWALVDAIWLNPKFLSGLIAIVLPVVQIPVVAVAGLVAWLAARTSDPSLPKPRPHE
ncbi:MAG: hypothetical protein Rubg2KO_08590 [Rubricoccaceae bacterium]